MIGAVPRRLVLLGSTGSIGTQALDVVSEAAGLRRPVSDATHEPFEVVALAAGAGHLELLAQQAVTFGVRAVGTSGTADDAARLRELIADRSRAASSAAPVSNAAG
mgnify:CR=1 FL=1